MSDTSRTYYFCGADALLPPPGREGAGFDPGEAPLRDYEVEGRRYRALSLGEEAASRAVAGGFSRLAARQVLGELDAAATGPFLAGLALLRWLETARFCGACGGALRDCPPEGESARGRVCASCARVFFPRISPAVIVLVRRGGEALLAHNRNFPAGRFGLLAGFVEAGESVEETAIREIREEAGIEIRDLRYRRSQSWPFPDSLMLAFTAEWASGEARPDGVEIEELRWCGPGDLPSIPPPGSVARRLIDEFVSGSTES